jgi:hypothetical protein
MISLPDFVVKQIDQISKRTNVGIDSIRRDYEAIFADVFIQQDEMFKSDRERHSFAIKILWIRYIILSSALTKEAEC